MKKASVVIIGGGISGLYAAYLLEKKGIDYVLLEARSTLGGRIVTAKLPKDNESIDSFDLGPSWFWPEYQQQLAQLIDELRLETVAQFEGGDMMVERSPDEAAVRTHGYKSSPPSMRLKGGMAALIDALYHQLDASRILTGQIVRQLNNTGECVEIGVSSEDASGQVTIWQAQHVLLVLPPRLVEESIVFQPSLPVALSAQWQQTATWMAPHAKYVAVYETPFWQKQGLSGAARSDQGPMVEIHDVSDVSVLGGSGALFGFIGVPALVRQSVTEELLKSHCRAQLVRLFGAEAANPKREYLKDWAQQPFTATAADIIGNGQHASAPMSKATSGVWENCLTGIGSEWSMQFSGYLAGAIDAADKGVQDLPESLFS